MSTSDPKTQLGEASIGHAPGAVAAALPDVSALAEMANAFFRILPGMEVPVTSMPSSPGLPGGLPGGFPGAGTVPPMPQSGAAAPSLPSLPSMDKIPNEADFARLSGSGMPSDFPPEVAAFTGSPVLLPFESPTGIMARTPAYPAPMPAFPPAVSPFSLPLPELDLPFPAFGAALPGIPTLPALGTEEEMTRLAGLPGPGMPTGFPSEAVSFGGNNPQPAYDTPAGTAYSVPTQAAAYPISAPARTSAPASPESISPFSLPLPELDLPFPAFGAALPDFPALPTLGVEEIAKPFEGPASLLYFVEHAGALSKPVASTSAPRQLQHFEPAVLPADAPLRRQFEITSIRRDFPILRESVNGHPLIWLDNAATTQKPQAVIDRLSWFYEHENSNIHRAAHELAARATDAYEDARQKVTQFLNAPSAKEIVFVRGATEAINLVAQSWGRRHIGKDDEIVISWIEHHANIVPWQMLCSEKGARLRVIPVDDDGQILLDEYEKLLNPRTRLVSFTQVSNALGTVTPAHQMVQMAHRYGARVLVDGAQAVSHMRVDVQQLDCDFYVFSGHKVFAPTGIGVLYGKADALEEAPPWQGGGNMIVDVTFEKTIYQAPPGRFEAGTGNIADAVGLGAAIAYLDQIGMENIARHEHDLLLYATKEMLKIPGLRIIGTAKEKAGVLSFVLDGYRNEDVGAALNREGIAVRSGHHCAQPTLRRFGQETTVRPSLALYNNYEDIDAMIATLRRLKQVRA